MGAEGIHEVGSIGMVGIVDCKVVNHQCELDVPGVMLPEAWGVQTWVITMGEQKFLELVIGKFASLW